MDVVAKAVTTGMSEDQARAASVRAKPAVVFIYDYDDKMDDPSLFVEKHKAFTDDQVAIGARFFDCLRIEKQNAKKDRVLSKYAKMAPVIVFLRPNYEPVQAIRGKFSARTVFGAMCKTMKVDYENCVRTAVKKQRKLMREHAKVDKLRAKEAKLADRIEDADGGKRRSLEKQRVKLENEIDEKATAIAERESAIYELSPKEEKKEKATS